MASTGHESYVRFCGNFFTAIFMVKILGVNPLAEASTLRRCATASQVPVSDPYRIVIGRPFWCETPVPDAADFFGVLTPSLLRLRWNEVAFLPCLSSARILKPSGLIVNRCLIFNV